MDSERSFLKTRSCDEIVTEALIGQGYDSIDPGDYVELHQVGYELIRKRQLHGAAALCLLSSTKFGFSTFSWMPIDAIIRAQQRSPTFVFHGSPVPPEQMGELIKPMSCVNIIKQGEVRVDQPHSSHSSGTLFPRIRSLLHHDHPDLQGLDTPLVFSRRRNIFGVVFSIAFRKVLERFIERGSTGWIYASDPPAGLSPVYNYADQKEYRVKDPVRYNYAVRTSVNDLPGSLIVLDGSDDAIWKYLDTFRETASPYDHAKVLGITAMQAIQLMPGLANTYCLHSLSSPRDTGDITNTRYDFKLDAYDNSLAAAEEAAEHRKSDLALQHILPMLQRASALQDPTKA